MACVLLMVFGLLSSPFGVESQVPTEFLSGYGGFSADIYKELSKTITGNFLVCPLSLDIAVSLTESGALGQTAEELKSVLRLPKTRAKIHEAFKKVSPFLQNNKNYTLSTANKIYVKEKYILNEEFKEVAVRVFDSEVENVDFEKNQEAADKINKWVEEKTHNKIKKLIDPNMLDSDTRTVIVNAIFFHGKWVKKFEKNETKKYEFYLNRSNQIKLIDMMVATTYYDYYENSELNAKFLKLDYEGFDVSMHIVLPNEIDGLAALEQNLSDVLTPPDYHFEEVSVRLPRFKMDTEIEFKPILQAMGVQSAFEDSANFSAMLANNENLKISKIVQKTFIEVEEEGTIAAAATAGEAALHFSYVLQTVVLSAALPPFEHAMFHANHPFLFYLRLNKLGINLFVGRYVSP